MFRVTHYLRELAHPTPPAPARAPAGPVVIWNLVRRCNLACRHCYSISADHDFGGELGTAEVFAVMDDLRACGVPVLILSGGEPLLRPDIDAIAVRALALGFYVGLSTNGTLIDDAVADRIAAIGYDYVGISLDGIGATHDRFRRRRGAFDASLAALRRCRARGVKVGMRCTMTRDNAGELPELLALMEDEGVDKFYLSHLNYAGRGDRNRGDDVVHRGTRAAMDLVFAAAWRAVTSGATREYVTGNNDADGPYLLRWAHAHLPALRDRLPGLRAKLTQWGGNSSGVNVANIDNLGVVHPDTFWWHHPLGNVRERSFGDIWNDRTDPIMDGLKARPRRIGGRCGACSEFALCGGNTRIRALKLTGDPWAEDPACYLTDAEIGVAAVPHA